MVTAEGLQLHEYWNLLTADEHVPIGRGHAAVKLPDNLETRSDYILIVMGGLGQCQRQVQDCTQASLGPQWHSGGCHPRGPPEGSIFVGMSTKSRCVCRQLTTVKGRSTGPATQYSSGSVPLKA